QHFLVANGGGDIVTKDGKLHTDDPAVREAAIKTTTWLSAAYKDGYVPPEALSWNDADDNNGFHEKLFVMDLDGTISTEVALIHNKKVYFEEMVTLGLPNRNDGKPMEAFLAAGGGFIPKGAKTDRGQPRLCCDESCAPCRVRRATWCGLRLGNGFGLLAGSSVRATDRRSGPPP
ncbi:MAG: hypothetical protein JO227_10805, partial [Acetobacteraceae bacterium]|nr:hypothetical protein [Acetobacteraceae bacterium]